MTDRTGLLIVWQRGSISYLCDEGHHERCTGLTSAGLEWLRDGIDPVARLCGCGSCDCNERARRS